MRYEYQWMHDTSCLSITKGLLKAACFNEKTLEATYFLLPLFCVVVQAWAVVPSILTETDAAQLVGKCAACQRPEEDPLGVLQLCGVSS